MWIPSHSPPQQTICHQDTALSRPSRLPWHTCPWWIKYSCSGLANLWELGVCALHAPSPTRDVSSWRQRSWLCQPQHATRYQAYSEDPVSVCPRNKDEGVGVKAPATWEADESLEPTSWSQPRLCSKTLSPKDKGQVLKGQCSETWSVHALASIGAGAAEWEWQAREAAKAEILNRLPGLGVAPLGVHFIPRQPGGIS